jgi:hypothetical protein
MLKNSKKVQTSHIVLKLKRTFVAFSPCMFNAGKFAQFGKRMGEDMGCFCVNEVQCLMMGELKQIEISSLKIIDRYIFASGIQRSFVKP